MNGYKGGVSRRLWGFPGIALPLWQGRYRDHIIRNEGDVGRIQEYVLNNPAQWTEDVFYAAPTASPLP
ncbi:hypothetical protein ANRL4_03605 [Anaerolineae bacterium]|nr:hypothetical protein ANRL4_03605 [Anaerolineae bacterium]